MQAVDNSVSSGACALHVLDHSWPILSGYSVRSRNLLRAQTEIGQNVIAVTSPLHDIDDVQSCDTVVDHIPYYRTSVSSRLQRRILQQRWPLVREFEIIRLLRRRILELIDRHSVSVVYAHSPALCGIAGLQAARKKGLPFVYEVRAFWEDAAVDQSRTKASSLRYRLTRELELHVARNADAVSAIAKPLLEDLKGRGIAQGKLFHVPNGVDAERFVPAPRETALAADLHFGSAVVLGFFGSLYKYEGIAWLIEAVAQLRARGNPVALLIIGGGEDEQRIQDAIRREDAREYVRVLGHVPHEQIQRYYALADIMVFPRLSVRLTELVTPLKPLEAMALTKPVLASDVGGHRELIDDEQTGLLFRSGDCDDFCSKAERLIHSPELRQRLGEEGRRMVIKEKNWKVLARRYQEIYSFVSRPRNSHRGVAVRQEAYTK